MTRLPKDCATFLIGLRAIEGALGLRPVERCFMCGLTCLGEPIWTPDQRAAFCSPTCEREHGREAERVIDAAHEAAQET